MADKRVIAYIDGFNLYHGLLDARLHTSRWLDLYAMCEALLRPGQDLDVVRYFTTRVRHNPAKNRRQSVFLDALASHGGIEIYYGSFLSKLVACKTCNREWQQREEKKTDVNIAVRLLEDAHDDRFDTAILISGDSDLVPVAHSIRHRFADKRFVVAFPPRRYSSELEDAATAAFHISAFHISPNKIRGNRLPDPVVRSDGAELRAPEGWLPTS